MIIVRALFTWEEMTQKLLSVDQVFTEAQQTQMVAAYSNQKKQPNAFEKRVSKAEVEKKAQKATISQSQEVTQEKHRSR